MPEQAKNPTQWSGTLLGGAAGYRTPVHMVITQSSTHVVRLCTPHTIKRTKYVWRRRKVSERPFAKERP